MRSKYARIFMGDKALGRIATLFILIGVAGKTLEKIFSSSDEVLGYSFYAAIYTGLLLSYINKWRTSTRTDRIAYAVVLTLLGLWLAYDAYDFLTR